ncbi:MAG: LON peptidase substrate-binding domain-containing protein, partial [Acidimicrobiia bacterium]
MPETETPENAQTPETDRLALPLLPLLSGVVLPQMVVTLALESDEARDAADAALDVGGRVVLVPRTGAGAYASVGTIARIESDGELPNGQRAVVLRGLARAHVGGPSSAETVESSRSGVWVDVVPIAERAEVSGRAREMAREYKAIVRGIAQRVGSPRIADALQGVDEPGALADTAGWSPELSVERKVELLETIDPEARIELALEWARDVLAELEVGEQIRHRVTDGMEKTQREYVLRQQLDAIRKELGETTGDDVDVVEEYRERLAAATVPDDVRAAVTREIDRLERMSEQSPEHSWIRTWIDTVFELPWGERSEDHVDVRAARAVLDADHTGLNDVKDRIVEFLA